MNSKQESTSFITTKVHTQGGNMGKFKRKIYTKLSSYELLVLLGGKAQKKCY